MDLSFESLITNGMLVGNLSYILLILSMAMRDILWLRLLAIASGTLGASYDYFWVNDNVGAFWELSFTLVNLVQAAWLIYERTRRDLSPEESRLRDAVFPMLSVKDFRRVLRHAERVTFLLGDIILKKGESVEHLVLVLEGEAAIEVESVQVARCGPGDFIGEIGFLNRSAASASVTALTTMPCLVFDVEEMRQVMERNSEFDKGFSVALNANLAAKLLRRNELPVTA